MLHGIWDRRDGGRDAIPDLLRALRCGDVRAIDVVEDSLRRIEERRDLNACVWSERERVLADLAARPEADRPLEALPMMLKDNIDTAGIPTMSGSLVDADRVPDTDATVWRRLRDRGAVLGGKAHLCEFAYRSHHPALGRVCNPRRPDRATGGSSSGSAAAVAAGLVPAALGTDTGGSVRIPSSYCGVVGLKGTMGLVEIDGVVPLSTTMDHVGVLAGSVTDAAIVFEQMPERPLELVDPHSLSVRRPEPGGVRIGIEEGYFASGAQAAVLRRWRESVEALEQAGCTIVPLALPDASRWRAAHKTVLLFEAWEYHADRMRASAPYGSVFRDAVSAGGRITRARYEAALRVRAEAQARLAEVLAGVDAMITPTTPSVAPPVDEGRSRVTYTRYTTLAAFTGVPAISVPAGTNRQGLPIGIQLVAGPHEEPTLVGVAALFEDLLREVNASTPDAERMVAAGAGD